MVCALAWPALCGNCVYCLWATTDYYQYEHQSQLCSESAGTTKYALGEEACADYIRVPACIIKFVALLHIC